MRDLPPAIVPVLRRFESVFSERVWEWAQVLVVGAILAPGKRTVTAVLRVMGLSPERQFQNYHRMLNRAVWSSRAVSRILLLALVRVFVPAEEPIVPSLTQRLADSTTHWEPATVRWYAGGTRRVELASGTAVWYHPGLPVVPLRWVLVRDPEGELEPQALLSTDLAVPPRQIVEWFVLRWQLEVTFEEARAHLGIETQRQWSNLAIVRTTPALLGLFSLVALFAHQLLQGQALPVRQAAWYAKPLPTFVDALALVRHQVWPVSFSFLSPPQPEMVQIPRALLDRLTDTLAFAA